MTDLEVGESTYQLNRKPFEVILLWILAAVAYIYVYYLVFDQIPFQHSEHQHYDSLPSTVQHRPVSTAHSLDTHHGSSPSTTHNLETHHDPLPSTAHNLETHNDPLPSTTHKPEIHHDSSRPPSRNMTSPNFQNHPSSDFHQIYVVNAYYIRFYTPSCFSSYYLSANMSIGVEPSGSKVNKNTSRINTGSNQDNTRVIEKLSISSENKTLCYEKIHLEHLEFYEELSKKGIMIKIRHEFWDLINVVSIEFEEKHLEIVKSIKGVKSVLRVYDHRVIPKGSKNPFVESGVINKGNIIFFCLLLHLHRNSYYYSESGKREWLPDTKIQFAPGTDVNFVHNFTGIELVRHRYGLTGNEIKVGIVDSGVDYTHPALGGCFGPGCRVRYGYDFVDNDRDPMDPCLGHGTHVAGIVGADDRRPEGTGFVGVAPDVIFGAYRVVKCDGYGYNDVILKGMEKAKDDGMDVINLSLSEEGWAESPVSEMADVLSKIGIVVVVANGNYGYKGLWESGVPAIGLDAISVSSVENTYVAVHKAVVTSELQKYIVGIFALESNSLVPLYPLLKPQKFPIPYATLIPEQFRQLVALAAELPELELDFSDVLTYFIPNKFGKTSSPFTSWGLTPEFDIKEISAPGGMIFSLYPLKFGGYSLLSGTSMASPYVAGSVALLLEKYGYQGPETPLRIRQELMNYAIPTISDYTNTISPVLQQGSGLLNVYNSISSLTSVTPIKLALNDTLNGNFSWRPLWIYNGGSVTKNYTLSSFPVASVDGYVNNTHSASYQQLTFSNEVVADVQFRENFVMVGPGENKSILIKITPPKVSRESRWFYSGFILVTSRDDDVNVTIPYAGYASVAEELPIMPLPTLPRLLSSTMGVVPERASAIFSMSDGDTPIVEYALITPTRYLQVHILDSKKKVLFLYAKANYVGKYPPKKCYPLWFAWDGLKSIENDTFEKVPDGSYYIRLRALKLLADPKDNKSWEMWISPNIIIRRY
ncbi:9309_t:CDS:2 [Acaulospora colombiana]|uniref:9309_t:CDS:1 n=1 Tax=Acaulospora colombiana TaxID=27376 RepID=A0ACA9M643_9GLOM|nr:9309_t:CDS:2 [Acaulospora colombiana]